jgi:FecR protein
MGKLSIRKALSACSPARRQRRSGAGPTGRRCSASVPLMLLGCWPILGAAQDCGDWQATFASVEGRVQIQAPGSTVWMDVAQNDVVCRGYRVRVDAFSRAALRLPDDSLMRLDESASLTITEPRDGIGSVIDILRGIIHVISRDPRSLRFNTPYANAGLEGTEFSIAVDDR